MPGQPKTSALEAHLLEVVDGQPRATYVLELIASGETIEQAANGLKVPYAGTLWTPNRRTLSFLLHKHWPDELADAKREAAEAYADKALDAVTSLSSSATREQVARADKISAMYRWLASKRDPATFGDAPAVAVQVNNPGQLFLQAVARPGVLPPPKQREDERGVGTAQPKREITDGA